MDHNVGHVEECTVVLICCIRAHGWIGAVIAAYAAAKGLCGDEDPILWVRRRYYMHAVETIRQMVFVHVYGDRDIQSKSALSRDGRLGWRV